MSTRNTFAALLGTIKTTADLVTTTIQAGNDFASTLTERATAYKQETIKDVKLNSAIRQQEIVIDANIRLVEVNAKAVQYKAKGQAYSVAYTEAEEFLANVLNNTETA